MEMEEWKWKNGNERMEVKYSATKEWPFWATVDKSYGCCSETDFEFLEATGRNVCVPAKPPNFTWNGKSVKSFIWNWCCICSVYS